MIEVDVPVHESVSDAMVLRRVEAASREFGLTIAMRGTLKTWPGSVHWHFKNGKQTGTLEMTWWGAKRRLWFKINTTRNAPWIDQMLPAMRRRLAKLSRAQSMGARS